MRRVIEILVFANQTRMHMTFLRESVVGITAASNPTDEACTVLLQNGTEIAACVSAAKMADMVWGENRIAITTAGCVPSRAILDNILFEARRMLVRLTTKNADGAFIHDVANDHVVIVLSDYVMFIPVESTEFPNNDIYVVKWETSKNKFVDVWRDGVPPNMEPILVRLAEQMK